MLFIKNANIVLENGIIYGGNIITKDDIIIEIGKNLQIPENAEVIDANGAYVGPGFVDIHVHGGAGELFYEEPQLVSDYFLKHGTTTILPTLYYNMTKDQMLDALKLFKELVKNENTNIVGVNMEGPYMNPEYGAMPHKNVWRGEIKKEDYMPVIEEAKGFAKIWSIAPEREGIKEFLHDLRQNDKEAIISIGHSEADWEDFENVREFGITLQTHSNNATGIKNKKRGRRAISPDEICLLIDDMYAELISDSQGIHVNSQMQQLMLKLKGIDKMVLITDSNAGEGNPPEEMKHIEDLMFDEIGKLSGSKLTMNMACKNVMSHTSAGITEAFLMASRNPAKVIGMDKTVGTIEIGKKANLVFVDPEFNVQNVIFNGKEIQKGE